MRRGGVSSSGSGLAAIATFRNLTSFRRSLLTSRLCAKKWGGFGYTSVLLGLGEYDTAAQIRDKLSLWCADTELTSRDVVVLYFAGHGVVEERDRHYLLCWDSRVEDCAATALPTEDLVRILCKGELRHLLIVLDACAGGAGVAEATATALQTIAYRQSGANVDAGLWFLSSARRKDVAADGAFVAQFPEAIRVATERTGQRQRFLDLTELVSCVNERFDGIGCGQRAELAGGLVTGLAPFLPNANFRPDLPSVGTDLEIQRRVAGHDLAEHFGPRSRGVEFESEQGLYFSGREAVLKNLVTWLTASTDDGKGRVVTGSPGCGKSAVLGRIVATSDPGYRARLNLSDADPATIAPENCVTAAVHARHKRMEEIVARIADTLGVAVEGAAGLLQELSRQGRDSDQPVVIAIDALDEAGSGTAADAGGRGEPRRIARELLRPMSDIHGVRLLVGTRRELISALGPTFTPIDLDTPEYRHDEDVAGYVRKVLLAEDEPKVATPYRRQKSLADTVAKGVAKRAAGVFLVARMTARSLRYAAPIDVSRSGWIDELPSEIGGAFDDFLARFGAEESRVRRMLLPLAFAEGHGLPRGKIWSGISTALSGIDSTEEDIAWTLNVAQAYIAEVVDDGRSVYRLYHQALAEHLRATTGRAAEHLQREIVNALISTVPLSSDQDRRDWFSAAPYVRQHLATHAQVSGQLESLIQDPGFLLASGQLALLSAFPFITGEEGREIRTAYEQIAHRLTEEHPLNGRAADLQLSARRCGADSLADRIAMLGLRLPWLAQWAWWSKTGAHRQLSGHTSFVECVATASLDGRPIAVTGGYDEAARVWDLITQRQIGEPLKIDVTVSAVAVGEQGDYTIALIGGIDGAVRIWDLSAGREYGTPLTGHTNSVRAIAVRNIGDRVIALTASSDGTARIWDLDERTQIGPELTVHRRTVHAAALGEQDGKPIAITGGDDKRMYIWDLSRIADGGEAKRDGPPLIGVAGPVTAISLAQQENRLVAVVGDGDGMLSVWDLATRQQIGEPVSAHVYFNTKGVLSVAAGQIGTSQVVFTCGAYDARLWDLNGLRQRGHPLLGHISQLNAAALADGEERPMGVTVSDDDTARIWDLTADQPASGHVGQVLAAAYADVEGQSLAVTGGADGTARLWDLVSRTEIGHPMEGHTGEVRAVALASSNGRPIAVTAGSDATVRLWDPLSGGQGAVLQGHTNAIRCLELVECDCGLMAVTGSEDGTIRLWDVHGRQSVGSPLTGHIGGVQYLAVRQLRRGIEIVAGNPTRAYVWRVTENMSNSELVAQFQGDRLDALSGMTRVIGSGFLRDRAVVLAAHSDNRVRSYDIRTADPVGSPLGGNSETSYSAFIGEIDGDDVIAVIFMDGVRIFALSTGVQVGELFRGGGYGPSFVEFAELEGKTTALLALQEKLYLCDASSVQPLGEPLCGNNMDLSSVSIVRIEDRKIAVSGSDDGVLRVHELNDGEPVFNLLPVDPYMRMLDALGDADSVISVVGGRSGLEIWNVTERSQVGVFRGHKMTPICMACCEFDDRKFIVSGSYDGEVICWDLATRTAVASPAVRHSAAVVDICTHTVDGRTVVASASADGAVHVWDARTGEFVTGPLGGHVYGATAVCVGSVVARHVIMTGDGDGSIRVWDMATGALMHLDLKPHPDTVRSIRLEQIGGRPIAVTADTAGLVRAWALPSGRCEAEVNVGAGIADIELTDDGDLCVATGMGLATLKLNFAGDDGWES